jgi:hypothetical protein
MNLFHLIKRVAIRLPITFVLLSSVCTVCAQSANPAVNDSADHRWSIRMDLLGLLLHLDYRYARMSVEGEYRFSRTRRLAATFDPEFIAYNERSDDTIPRFQLGPSFIYQHHFGFNFGLRGYVRPFAKRLNYWIEPQLGLGIGYAQLMSWISPLVEHRVAHFYPTTRLRAGMCLRLSKVATIGLSMDGYARKYYGLPKQELRAAAELNLGINF